MSIINYQRTNGSDTLSIDIDSSASALCSLIINIATPLANKLKNLLSLRRINT